MGNLSQRGEWSAVYQGSIAGVGEVCDALLTTLHVTLTRVKYAKDQKLAIAPDILV